jgi:hypothetical protein
MTLSNYICNTLFIQEKLYFKEACHTVLRQCCEFVVDSSITMLHVSGTNFGEDIRHADLGSCRLLSVLQTDVMTPTAGRTIVSFPTIILSMSLFTVTEL